MDRNNYAPRRSRLHRSAFSLKGFFQDIHRAYRHKKSVKGVIWYLLRRYKRQLFFSFLIFLVIMILIPIFTYFYFASDLKDKDSIMNRGRTGLTLLDRDGEEFFSFYQPKNITYISLSEVPEQTQQSVIAAEDKNFYNNAGFSIRGIARAFIVNFFAGKVVEGGSTITQELAKNAFLSSSRNVLRKYQELVLAAELNRRFTKQDILEMYLNSVYFGEGAFGIENAAQAYFGVPAKDLTLSQSALLIGLLPAPSAYSPLSNDPEIAIRKRNIVLQEMIEDKFITQEEANAAKNETPVYNPSKKADNNTLAPHFAIYVKNYLIKKYGEERVIREGFQVKTTLNRTEQEYAQRAVHNQLSYLRGNHASNGAAVAIDPKNGQILVMVGSYDWNDPKFGQANMAIIPRQPGSSFKPIIYADGIERKLITAATILHDTQTTFPGNYTPHDFDRGYRGEVTVRRALANSLNIPAVEVMEKVGVPAGLERAQKFGITTLGNDAAKYGLSLVLGSGEVKLLDLTSAYAALADKGVYHEPTAVLEVTNKYGKKIEETNFFSSLLNFFKTGQTTHNAVSEDTAFIISSILSDNRTRAEEFGGALNLSRPAAVKTGTTEDFHDALTVGYTPNLVVGVWVGNNDNTPMDNIAGSLGAAPIWRNLMENFLLGTKIENFHQPISIVEEIICPMQFKYEEFFISGTQPTSCGQPTKAPSPTKQQSPTPTNKPNEPTPTETPTPTPAPTNTPVPTTAPPTVTQTTTLPTLIPTILP